MFSVKIRLADPSDLPCVAGILADAAAWLNDRGVRQWPEYGFPEGETLGRLRRGETYLALLDDIIVGTISLDTSGEPFWSPEEAESSLFIHRLAVVRAHAGRGLGKALLDFARCEAKRRGCKWLRLDCVGDNEGLKTYYKHEGFTLVKIVPLPHDDSEALFAQRVDRLSKPD
jgi:GNAT superfamily N-acetyltransferase